MTQVLGALGTAAVISYLGLALTFMIWFRAEWAKRRVRMTAATWTRFTYHSGEDDKELLIPVLNVAVFNGLVVDVGIHRVSMDLRQGKKKLNVIAPVAGDLPSSIKAQHSVSIALDGPAVLNLREIYGERSSSEPWSYRIRVKLGNGSDVWTKWEKLDERKAASSTAGGTGADY